MSKVKIFLFLYFLFFFSLPVLAQVDTGWVRRYIGPGYGPDWALALAVDDSGNVYITGNSANSSSYPYNYDYATIKYAPNGDTLWVTRYNGPGNDDDVTRALAVDGSGNVYVTGYSWSGTDYDYATIKYAPNGDTLWIRRFNGAGNTYDQAYALQVDASGNVYVTGTSSSDYATIKYSPAGDTLWIRSYDGPVNGFDAALSLAVDGTGNVYVAGQSVGSGTSDDYATIKYAPNGDILWVRRYNGPANNSDAALSLAVDGSGNVYVTGYDRDSSFDYATIKYAPNGDTLWVRRYNGPGDSTDAALSLAVDGSGNVYVTGRSGGSGTSDDYATIKYAPNGDTLWVRRYNGPGNNYDHPSALAVDDSGNVYVTGRSGGSGTSDDYATIKYAPNGDTLWVRRYNGPRNFADLAFALVVDGSGNVYVTGGSWGGGIYADYASIKYNMFGCIAKAGDANGDYKVNLADIIFEVNYVFKGGSRLDPFCADVNADDSVNLSDIIYSVNFVFKGGPAPLESMECCL